MIFGYRVISNTFYGDNLNNLEELKGATHKHVRNIFLGMLRATVENVAIRFNLLSKNGGHRTEHPPQHVSETINHI